MSLIAAATAGCVSAAPSHAPSPTAVPAANSFDEYAVAFCSAWEHLFLAVGNPDTAEGSVLSKALDEAVASRDGTKAEQVAGQITQEIMSGREDVAVGAGWPPAAPIMVQMDRVFIGFQEMTAAKVAKAQGNSNAVDPQVAFEGSGALVAWSAMFQAHAALGTERPASARVRRLADLAVTLVLPVPRTDRVANGLRAFAGPTGRGREGHATPAP
jgi:hypothetical protein